MRTQRLAALVIFLSSCTLSETDWCQACSEGQTCVSGVCQPVGAADLSVGDLAAVDLAVDAAGTPDLDTTFGSVPGCVGPGRAVGSVFACLGTFGVGGAAKLCASGYAPLADGTRVSDPDCRALSGFFAGTPILSRYTAGAPNSGTCGALPGVGQIRQFAGCGKSRTTVVDVSCSGFRQAIDLVPDPSWDSSGNTLDSVSNSNPGDGVLCAK